MPESSEGGFIHSGEIQKPVDPVFKGEQVNLPPHESSAEQPRESAQPGTTKPLEIESPQDQAPSSSGSSLPSPNTTYISPKSPSLLKRVGNFLSDSNLGAFVSTSAKAWGTVFATNIVFSALGHLDLAPYAAVPISAFILREAYTSVADGGIRLGTYTCLIKKYNTRTQQTPVGVVRSGELIGSLRLINSLGKMSDLPVRERAFAVPLDALRGLEVLRKKFEQGSKDVEDIVAIKASSHLVSEYDNDLTSLGFTLEPPLDSRAHELGNNVGKLLLVTPVWGIRQLFRERSLRGFREAASTKLGKTQTAWITPQKLCSDETKTALQQGIERVESVLEKLHARQTAKNPAV